MPFSAAAMTTWMTASMEGTLGRLVAFAHFDSLASAFGTALQELLIGHGQIRRDTAGTALSDCPTGLFGTARALVGDRAWSARDVRTNVPVPRRMPCGGKCQPLTGHVANNDNWTPYVCKPESPIGNPNPASCNRAPSKDISIPHPCNAIPADANPIPRNDNAIPRNDNRNSLLQRGGFPETSRKVPCPNR